MRRVVALVSYLVSAPLAFGVSCGDEGQISVDGLIGEQYFAKECSPRGEIRAICRGKGRLMEVYSTRRVHHARNYGIE